jgi:hypothetical protein
LIHNLLYNIRRIFLFVNKNDVFESFEIEITISTAFYFFKSNLFNYIMAACSKTSKKLCEKEECGICFERSFASHEKSNYWSKNNTVSAREVFKGSCQKYEFLCGSCEHYFEAKIYNITKIINPTWCPYCTNQKLCNGEKCKSCFEKSFASHEKSKWWSKQNELKARQVFKQTHGKYFFYCDICSHDFSASLSNITRNQKPAGCSFCSKKQVCGEDTCQKCFENSFASHEKSKYWSERNLVLPKNILKSSDKKFEFKCGNCDHYFISAIHNIRKGSWCPYCSKPAKKLCDREDCKQCFENSFASHPKSKWWSLKNNTSPRKIFRGTKDEYIFDCDICKHEFNASILSITGIHKCWCTYCSLPPKSLCLENDCDWCFNKSFASHEKSKWWSKRNAKIPREVFKNAFAKYEFYCEKCDNYFIASLNDISRKNGSTWCPICKVKSEKKLGKWLKEEFPDTKIQYKPSWCPSPETERSYSFDFFIPSINIIIELDGEQHFRQIMNWESPKRAQSKDLYKMKMAYDRKITMIRIPYKYVYEDFKFSEYKEKIKKECYFSEIPRIVYLCEKDEYSHFNSFDFNGEAIPKIVPK